MPTYLGAGFAIDLPDDAVDASVYAFAFPQGRPFTPTLVIRSERHGTPRPLADYVDGQVALLKGATPGFEVLRRRAGRWHDRAALDLLVESGEPGARLRQRLVYVDGAGQPQHLWCLTATDTADRFESNEGLFNRAILSFVPRSPDPPTSRESAFDLGHRQDQ